MNEQAKLTRTMIQGAVNNVFDVAEKYGVIPQPEDFCAGIKAWIEEGILIRTLPGIDNKRLPVPEVNSIGGHCVICDRQIDIGYIYCSYCDEWMDKDEKEIK